MFVEILTAISLVLVIEGLLPFINPAGYKNAIRVMLEQPDSRMRIIGLCSMIAGVILLTLVR